MDMKLHDQAHDPDTIAKLIAELTEGFESHLEPWIIETLQYPLNVYQVVGLLLRFGALTTDRSIGFNSFIEGRENPVTRAAAWARSLSKEQLDYVFWLMYDGADQTLTYIEGLAYMIDNGHEGSRVFWLVCMTRDDTENLRVLLNCAGYENVDEVTDILDETVLRDLEELGIEYVDEPYDPRLDSAALNEPGIWWGPHYGDLDDDDWIVLKEGTP